MQNILYCFDENYNIQGFCSIISMLEKSSVSKNIYIIHKDPESFNQYIEIIQNHKMAGIVEIYKFENKDYKFHNLDNKHVSEATYYRLFMTKYLPKHLDGVLYVDADAYFISEFEEKLEQEFISLKKSEYLVSALTNFSDDDYSRLGLKNGKYFNAGVVLIDYKKWLIQDVTGSLLKIFQNPQRELIFWDQDILNIYFDGKYKELETSLNFNVYGDQQKKDSDTELIEKEATIVHYSGKHKPWSPKGIFSSESKFYLEIYRSLFEEKYHIVNIWSYNTLKILIKNVLSLNILKLEYPASYFWICINSIIQKK